MTLREHVEIFFTPERDIGSLDNPLLAALATSEPPLEKAAMTDPIIEAAARAVQMKSDYVLSDDNAQRVATAVLAAVTPMIRAAALEEAAKVAEDCEMNSNEEVDAQLQIAAAIRALKTVDKSDQRS